MEGNSSSRSQSSRPWDSSAPLSRLGLIATAVMSAAGLWFRAVWTALIRRSIPRFLAMPPPPDNLVSSKGRTVLGTWYPAVVADRKTLGPPFGGALARFALDSMRVASGNRRKPP